LNKISRGIDIDPPVVVVIGEVVALGERLRWWLMSTPEGAASAIGEPAGRDAR